MQSRKAGIVKQLTTGIVGLFKASRRRRHQGPRQAARGQPSRSEDGRRATRRSPRRTSCSRPARCPSSCRWRSSTASGSSIRRGALAFDVGAEAARRDRRRRDRPRVRQRLAPARLRGHDPRGARHLPGDGDQQIAKEALRHFKKQGLDIRLGAKITGASGAGGVVKSTYADAAGGADARCDELVVSVGRRPYTTGLCADGAGLQLDERGFVEVDDDCRTQLPNVWAVGDVVRGPMLAHKGEEEGVDGRRADRGPVAAVDFNTVPWVIYTRPEIAWVGQTEQQLRRRAASTGRHVPVHGERPRPRAGRHDRLREVDRRREDDEILGVHIVGPVAGELIAEAVLAMEFQASAEDMRPIHAHPTLSEALHEAALAVDKRAIHAINR